MHFESNRSVNRFAEEERGAGSGRPGRPAAAAGHDRLVRHRRRRGEARPRGPRSRRELGQFPPDAAAHRLGRRRPADQALAHERIQGVGGRHVPRPLQQRLQRAVPPAPGAGRVEQRGQEHPRLGHDEAHVPAHIPPRERALLDPHRPSDAQPLRRRARRR